MNESEVAIYLGQKGYSIKKENMEIKEQLALRKDLMVKPFVPKSSMAKAVEFPLYRESKKKFYIPRYYGLETYGEYEISKIEGYETIDLEFNGELREHQKPTVEKYVKHAHKKGGGLLELFTGYGKTVCALKIIAELNVKTLIIVHKEFLLRQWVERIEQFLPDAKVGRLQGSTIDIENKDIVIGMLQSLSMKDYEIELFKSFGLTIVDECHHIGAEVFSRALFKVVTKYTLGLSATMKRKDGLTKVIKMFLGKVVVKKEREGKEKVCVKTINYEVVDEDFNRVELNFRGQTHYSKMIKKLCEFNPRRDFILKVLEKILKDDKECESQIMILGHNRNLLTYLHDAIKYRGLATVGYYVGGMKEEDLKISEGKQVVIATYAMAEEGLDIKTLTTLIMATPKTDVTQAVGRILRKKGKEKLVVDIVDSHEMFQRQYTKRRRFYNKQNFKIMETDIKGFKKDDWTTYSRKRKTTKANKKNQPLLQGKLMFNLNDD